MNNSKRLAIPAFALVALISGCTGGSNEPRWPESSENLADKEENMKNTLTTNEAVELLEEHIANTVSVLPEALHLEPIGPVIKGASCDDPTDDGPQDRVTASRRYWLDGLSIEDNETNVELIYQYWVNNDYVVLEDLRPEKIFVSVQHEEDNFRMSVRSNVEGYLSIGSSSPCFWPDGVPAD